MTTLARPLIEAAVAGSVAPSAANVAKSATCCVADRIVNFVDITVAQQGATNSLDGIIGAHRSQPTVFSLYAVITVSTHLFFFTAIIVYRAKHCLVLSSVCRSAQGLGGRTPTPAAEIIWSPYRAWR